MAVSGLGPMVAALWKELGLAPPVGQIGTEFDFDLGEMPLSLALQDNGETVTVRGCLGYLEGHQHEAGDQLSRLQRLGLALTALNAAALDAAEAQDILEAGHEGAVPVYAVALAQLSTPSSILPAVRAVLDWQAATGSILARNAEPGDDGAARARAASPSSEADVIIFQP